MIARDRRALQIVNGWDNASEGLLSGCYQRRPMLPGPIKMPQAYAAWNRLECCAPAGELNLKEEGLSGCRRRWHHDLGEPQVGMDVRELF